MDFLILKKTTSILLITSVYCLFNHCLAQESKIDENKPGRIHLYLNVNPNFNYYLKFPENYILCFEGCNTIGTSPTIGLSADLGFTYNLNSKHSLKIGAGFTHYNLNIEIEDLYSNINYTVEENIPFLSLVAGHLVHYDNWTFESTAVVDHNINDHHNIKSWNLSYRAAIVRTLFHRGIMLSAGPYFKMAVTNYYSKEDEFFPFSFGVQIMTDL